MKACIFPVYCTSAGFPLQNIPIELYALTDHAIGDLKIFFYSQQENGDYTKIRGIA